MTQITKIWMVLTMHKLICILRNLGGKKYNKQEEE
jgi:hypothetical protein